MRYAMQGEYVIWIVVSTIGILQALASYYRWDGLSFFRGHRVWGYLTAAVLVGYSYSWFFSYRERDVPGLEGWQLFSRFALAAALGLIAVLALSSILNADMERQTGAAPGAEQGVDALSHATFAQLLSSKLAARRSAGGQPGAETEDKGGQG